MLFQLGWQFWLNIEMENKRKIKESRKENRKESIGKKRKSSLKFLRIFRLGLKATVHSCIKGYSRSSSILKPGISHRGSSQGTIMASFNSHFISFLPYIFVITSSILLVFIGIGCTGQQNSQSSLFFIKVNIYTQAQR